jgi:hypothetical protein
VVVCAGVEPDLVAGPAAGAGQGVGLDQLEGVADVGMGVDVGDAAVM